MSSNLVLLDTCYCKNIRESCSSVLFVKQRKYVLQNKKKCCLIHTQVGIGTESPGKDPKAIAAISLHLECSLLQKSGVDTQNHSCPYPSFQISTVSLLHTETSNTDMCKINTIINSRERSCIPHPVRTILLGSAQLSSA